MNCLTMEYACNVVYVDRTAAENKLHKRSDVSQEPIEQSSGSGAVSSRSIVQANLEALFTTFEEVHVCKSAEECISRIQDLDANSATDLIPTIVLVEVSPDRPEDARPRTPSPMSASRGPVTPTYQSSRGRRLASNDGSGPLDTIVDMHDDSEVIGPHDSSQDALRGMHLLRWIRSEIDKTALSKLVLPVAMTDQAVDKEESTSNSRDSTKPFSPRLQTKYMDNGAVAVVRQPLTADRISNLPSIAYYAHKVAMTDHKAASELNRGRKRSWVGLDDQKPYSYLREAMVSSLMDGICRSSEMSPIAHKRISLPDTRLQAVSAAVATWDFSAHDFSDDELMQAAVIMLEHALSMPQLEKFRISTEQIATFLKASKAAYNSFVPYHNFRHVIDVLQACFHFLIRTEVLPPFPAESNITPVKSQSPFAANLRPFDALTLLITAIGHDVGHPGVNNAFLVALNAPLAQLYNDRSVLESFHCAAYSQILRRHWPAAFTTVEMRQLMISSILATDMGMHFDYMKKLGFLQEKLGEDKNHISGAGGRLREEYRTLACSLLIKCADISNVARKFDIAVKWTMILTDEFARQATMERDLSIPTRLFAPPVRETVELGKSQISFMNVFALPLFEQVTTVLPQMQFCVDELKRNCSIWEKRIKEEQELQRRDSDDSVTRDGLKSPRHLSMTLPFLRKKGSGLGNGSNTSSPRQSDAGQQRSSKQQLTMESELFKSLSDVTNDSSPLRQSPEVLMPPQWSIGRQGSNRKDPETLILSSGTSSAPGPQPPSTKVVASLATDAVVPEDLSIRSSSAINLSTHSFASKEGGDTTRTLSRASSSGRPITSRRTTENDKPLHKKSSRSRFKFWKRKGSLTAEDASGGTPPSRLPTAVESIAQRDTA